MIETIERSPLSVTQTGNESVDFRRQENFWHGAPLCALTDKGDGIVVGEVVSSRVVKEHAHQVPNLGTTSSGEWMRPKPHLNFDCSDRVKIGRSHLGTIHFLK